MPNNKLTTEFEVLDSKAIARTDAFVARLQSATKTIQALPTAAAGTIGAFDKQVGQLEASAGRAQRSFLGLIKTDAKGNAFDGISQSAIRLQKESALVRVRLAEIQALDLRGKSPSFLKIVADDAETALMRLTELEKRAVTLQNRRAGPAGGGGGIPGLTNGNGQLRGAGPIFRAAGLYQYGLDESIINAANTARLAAGISGAGLAAIGGVAALGVGVVKISEHIRDVAKTRLGYEEAIAGAMSKQIIAGQKLLTDQAKLDADAVRARQLEGFTKQQDIASLQARADLLEKINKLDPNSPDAEQNATDRRAILARIAAIPGEKTAAADANFAARNEAFKASQKQLVEFEKQRDAEKLQRINEQRQKVSEIAKAADDLFAGLSAKLGASNPFVAVFSEADKMIEQVRLSTAGLTDDLQKQAAEMASNVIAANLFTARLDNNLNVSQLSADARDFRSRGGSRAADQQAANAIARFQSQRASGLFSNPDNLLAFSGGTTAAGGLALFDFQRQQERNGGLFRNPIFEAERRRQIAAQDPAGETASQKLDRQLSVIRGLNPTSEADRATADRKIIALTQGLKPEDLSPEQRNAAAAARENEAVRLGNAEKTALADRTKDRETQAAINTNIAQLLEIAKKDGLTGVIRIINDAEDKANVSIGKRPAIRDAKKLTDL